MKKEDAEEYTQSLGQIVSGSWRQIAVAKRIGVPKALGLSVEEWVNKRLGGYVKQSIADRRGAVKELSDDGESTRAIADVLGVTKSTVDRDLNVPNGTPDEKQAEEKQEVTKEAVPNGTPEPLDTMTGLAADEAIIGKIASDKAKEERKDKQKEKFIENTTDDVVDMPDVTILHGDVMDMLKDISSNSVDLCCIDPPYNMDKADWDSFGSGEEFADWAEQWLYECKRVLKHTGAIYIFGINRMLSHLQHRLENPEGLGFKFRSWITWDTIQGAGGGLWVNRAEGILYFSVSDEVIENNDAVKLERHEANVREYKGKEYKFKNPSNIWRFPCVDDKSNDRTPHPTQKPIELVERIVKASSPDSGVVLDCFMGSGTTGVACLNTGRKFIGIEKDGDYIDMANRRMRTVVA